MGPPLAPFYRLTKHYSLKCEGRALRGEVTRAVEGEPCQGGAQSQRRGSDTAEVSNDSPGIVLVNYEMHVHFIATVLQLHLTECLDYSISPSGYNIFIAT